MGHISSGVQYSTVQYGIGPCAGSLPSWLRPRPQTGLTAVRDTEHGGRRGHGTHQFRSKVQYITVQLSAVQCGSLYYTTEQHSTLQHISVQYSSACKVLTSTNSCENSSHSGAVRLVARLALEMAHYSTLHYTTLQFSTVQQSEY